MLKLLYSHKQRKLIFVAKHKITMRDIAKDCGVSVATVSYVLNHSQKEKISHETRLKILESATRLHYAPKAMGKHAIEQRSNLAEIVIHLKDSNNASKKMLFYDLAAELSDQLHLLGFETILMATKELSQNNNSITRHNPDALFIIDADIKLIQKFTKDYYIPILFMDCEINNPLFCRIYPDYADIIETAKKMLGVDFPFLVMEDINNLPLRQQITEWFRPPDVFINVPGADLERFLMEHKNEKGIVLGDILGMQTERLFPRDDLVVLSSLGNTQLLHRDLKTLYVRNKEKAAAAAKVFQNMLNLDYEAEDDNRILIKCEYR